MSCNHWLLICSLINTHISLEFPARHGDADSADWLAQLHFETFKGIISVSHPRLHYCLPINGTNQYNYCLPMDCHLKIEKFHLALKPENRLDLIMPPNFSPAPTVIIVIIWVYLKSIVSLALTLIESHANTRQCTISSARSHDAGRETLIESVYGQD